MTHIEHVPLIYYLPGAPEGALERRYRELADEGTIRMHADAWVPQCLVDDGIVPCPPPRTPSNEETPP